MISLSKNIPRNGPRNCRSLGCAPNDTGGRVESATTPFKPYLLA
jgi:hypothetical protein